MRQFLTIILMLCLSAHTAAARDGLDRVRVLLDAGDTEALQSELEDLHRTATKTGDMVVLRTVNRRLFATTHPQRRNTITRWVEEYPRSEYAQAAFAWMKFHETSQWAASYRIDAHVHSSHTRPKWIEVSQAAIEHAKIGLARSEAYIGTLEVWLSVYQNSIFHTKDKALERRTRLRISAALMGLAPDHESLLLIVAAAAESGNPEQDVLEVCLKFADVVPGYGEDMCVIEAALHHYLGRDIKEAARAALATQTSPYVDDAWLGYQLSASRDDAKTDDSDRMIALHLKRLHGRVDLDQFRRDAGKIMGGFDRPDHAAVADGYVLDYLDDLLPDDPLNALHLRVRADILSKRYQKIGDAADLKEARATWEQAMTYGEHDYRLWKLGAELAIADRDEIDVGVQLSFWNNAIACSGQSVMEMFMSVYYIHNARETSRGILDGTSEGDRAIAERTLSQTSCAYLRAARTVEALCRANGFSEGGPCNPEKPLMKMVSSALKEQKNDLCPSISATPLSELRFEPIAFEEITLPWHD